MTNWQIVLGVAGLVFTIFGAILAHILTSVWWASKITTTLTFMIKTLEEIKLHQDGYVTKEVAVREFTTFQTLQTGMFKRLDEIRNRLDIVEKDLAFMKGADRAV